MIHLVIIWSIIYVKVKVEGEPDEYFDRIVLNLPIINNAPTFSPDDVCKPIDTSLLNMGGSGSRSEDIALACSQGFDFDDNNKPAPENVPAEGVVIDITSNLYGQTWGWGGKIYINRFVAPPVVQDRLKCSFPVIQEDSIVHHAMCYQVAVPMKLSIRAPKKTIEYGKLIIFSMYDCNIIMFYSNLAKSNWYRSL